MPEIPVVPARWRFPAHPASVGRARRAVAEALPCGVAPRLGAELGLITSELVTNAVRAMNVVIKPSAAHATRPTRMDIRRKIPQIRAS